MEVGLGPDDIVLDGDSAPLQKAAQPPLFGPCLLCQTVAVSCPSWVPGGAQAAQRFLANVLSPIRLSVCLSVTLVHPTQAVEIFGNISTAFGTLAIY